MSSNSINPITIECSARDALVKSLGKENSEWENNTTYPINLKAGDQVVLKNVFIDTGGSDITLSEPLNISGLFGFYDVNYTWAKDNDNNIEKTGFNGLDDSDYNYYLAWDNDVASVTVKSFRCDFAVPSSCGFIDVIIQASFTYDTETETGLTWKMNAGKRLTCANRPYTIELADWGGEVSGVIPTSIRNVQPNDPNAVFVPNSFVLEDGPATSTLLTNTFSMTIDAGSYTRDQLAKIITDNLSSIQELNQAASFESSNPFLFRTDNAKWTDNRLRFYEVGKSPNDVPNPEYYVYKDHTGALTPYWMGASQVSLIWDDAANHFSWDFLHTPYANDNEIGIGIYGRETGPTSTVLHQCGVFFMDLQPRDFWQTTLNFNLNDILVTYDIDDGEATQTISETQLKSKITKGLLTLQSLFPSFDRNIKDVPNPLFEAVDQTIQLKGQNIASINDTFYLVEINIGNEVFSYRGDINNQIRAIIGAYYQESNWVQGYSSDSIVYEHVGDDQTISKIKIRILDPNTKQPIKTLGNNSFVYVQIIPAGSNAN
jgi:hypothetical protein